LLSPIVVIAIDTIVAIELVINYVTELAYLISRKDDALTLSAQNVVVIITFKHGTVVYILYCTILWIV